MWRWEVDKRQAQKPKQRWSYMHAFMQRNLVAVSSSSTNSGANAFKGDELSEAANNRLTKLQHRIMRFSKSLTCTKTEIVLFFGSDFGVQCIIKCAHGHLACHLYDWSYKWKFISILINGIAAAITHKLTMKSNHILNSSWPFSFSFEKPQLTRNTFVIRFHLIPFTVSILLAKNTFLNDTEKCEFTWCNLFKTCIFQFKIYAKTASTNHSNN